MARDITITFTYDINDLVQVNDIVYYQASGTVTITKLGTVAEINFTNKTITVTIADTTKIPSDNDYIFFSKDNKAHQSDITGYYAEAVMKNNSTEEAELYQLSAEIAESSK